MTSAEVPAKYKSAIGREMANHADTTKLHSAVWKNQPELVEHLLSEGAAIDVQDGESGWTALHRAFYWGNFRCAAVLLAANAHLSLTDYKGRTALDLLSEELKPFMQQEQAGIVYSWGNGANYQLGTGATGLQPGAVRLDALRKELVVQIAAAKFHSAAVTKDGRLFTWGFGRGGRLGHPDFHVHSGESAIITPRAVTAGLGRRQVAVVAVAKHHTAVATTSFELFTWGSNRDGRLGYAAVDTQPTPRKVTSLKQRVVAVAAANKHTAVLTDQGAIYSWGANDQGQLGYGTSDSASNAVPRQVEAMKGKRLVAVAAAKRHTVVMTNEGDIFTWGHRVVTPRRVQLAGARAAQRNGYIAFHKGQAEISRPHAVAITAGVAHSCCLTSSGVVLAWRSWDSNLALQEVTAGLAGKKIVSIAAGKYRTAAVTDEGDVYMWEGLSKQHPHRKKAAKDASLPPRPDKAASRKLSLSDVITPERVEGLKRVSKACVGEKHSLALQCWCHSPKQLRLPILAEAAALPASTPRQPPSDPEDLADLVAQAQEDAEWNAAADRAAGGANVAAASAATAEAAAPASMVDAGLDVGERMRNDGEESEWLGHDFWLGLEAAHKKIQAAARAEAEASAYFMAEAPVSDNMPSLQRLCERSIAEHLVEPRTCLQIMQWADACGAEVLKQFCCGIALSNLDTVLLEARGVFENIEPHLLAELDDIQKAQFSPECPSGLPDSAELSLLSRRPTAAAQCLGIEEGFDAEDSVPRRTSLVGQALVPSPSAGPTADLSQERSFCNPEDTEEAVATGRQIRNLKKKLQQIEALEVRKQDRQLDPQQQAKLAQRAEVVVMLEALQSGASVEEAQKLALSHKGLVPTSFSGLQHSLSMLSMDSANSNGKPKAPGGKHKSPAGRASRQDLTKQPASDAHSDQAAAPSALDAAAAELSSAHAPAKQPVSSTAASARQPEQQTTSSSETADVSASQDAKSQAATPKTKPSAWGCLTTSASSPVTGFRVSGFSTPQGQKAEGSLWPSPLFGTPAAPSAAQGTAGLTTPTSAGAAKKTKPPRKGGLSMFLSGDLEKAATPPTPPPPPPPSAAPPAEFSWGGPKASPQALTSLRDIQNQEAASTGAMRSSHQHPGLLGTRRPSKQDFGEKDRESRDSGSEHQQDRNRVPLEALVRKSSPIAVAKKEEPAEPQGPAWGGVLLGTSPPGPGADATAPQEAKPRLSDIQAEQERVRDSCSRSFGAAGSSPGSAGRDGFASFLHWRGGSGVLGPVAGSSPGAMFPAGTSPHTAKKVYMPSPQQNSKWYIKEERPVVALQDIQSEEYSRELQAQQEAATAKKQAEEAAAAAEAKKALKKKQRQQRQARAKAAAQAQEQATAPAQAVNLAHIDNRSAEPSGFLAATHSSQDNIAALADTAEAATGRVPSANTSQRSNPNRQRNRRASDEQHTIRNNKGQVLTSQQEGNAAGGTHQSGVTASGADRKPRVLEVRRPQQAQSSKGHGMHKPITPQAAAKDAAAATAQS